MLLPWGWGYDKPDNIDDLYRLVGSVLTTFLLIIQIYLRVAEAGNNALYAVHQKTYEVGCIPCLLYIASGSSADWAHGDQEIPFSISMELRDTGNFSVICC